MAETSSAAEQAIRNTPPTRAAAKFIRMYVVSLTRVPSLARAREILLLLSPRQREIAAVRSRIISDYSDRHSP